MSIRRATFADMERCASIEGSYVTDYVWQMEEAVTAEGITVAFRRMRLPRHMEVAYPRATQDLNRDLLRNECFLVADEPGVVLAYLDMTVRRWQAQGWIEHLVVRPTHRRQGLATHLLEAARKWGRENNLVAIVGAAQTKNDPAMCLLTKMGYAFAGFIDHYFSNGDIGILYSLEL